MRRIKTLDQRATYQEINQDKNAILDSMIIDQFNIEVPLVSYMQQSLNQLRLYGYTISQETQKSLAFRLQALIIQPF